MNDYILFDLDGTLTDPKVGITTCVQYALASFGVEEPSLDKLTPFIGPPLKDSFKEFYGFDDDQAEAAVAKYRERFKDTGIFENQVYKGIPEMLKKLKAAGKKLAVASSKPTVFVERILEHFSIRRYFDVVVGSELDGTRTDKAEVIEEALGQLYSSRKEGEALFAVKRNTLMVGDRKFDVEGAKKEGVTSVAVTYGYGSMEELKAAKADYIVRSVEELEKLLLRGSEKVEKEHIITKLWYILQPVLVFYLVRVLGLSVGSILLASIGGSLPPQIADKLVYWNEAGDMLEGATANGSALMTAFAFLLAGVVTWFVFAREDIGKAQKELALKPSCKKPPIAYACMTAGILGMAMGLNILYEVFGITNISETYQEAAMTQYAAALPLGLLVHGLLAPVAEELVFRGVTYNRLKKYMTAVPAIGISALLFGIYHGNVVQGTYAFLMGCAIAFLYESFGDFRIPLAAHIISNVAAYLLTMTGIFNHVPVNGWTGTGLLLIGLGGLMMCCRPMQSKRTD